MDDYGDDDYGLRMECAASSTVIVAVIVNRNDMGTMKLWTSAYNVGGQEQRLFSTMPGLKPLPGFRLKSGLRQKVSVRGCWFPKAGPQGRSPGFRAC